MYTKLQIFYVKLILSFRRGKRVFTETDLTLFDEISNKSQI